MVNSMVHSRLFKGMAVYLSVAMTVITITDPLARAMPVTTGMIITNGTRQAELNDIQKALEQKLVAEKLKSLGYSDKEIMARVGQLNDKQLSDLAQKARSINSGGDFEFLGFIIALLIIAILVILILELYNRKIVVKTEPAK